MYDTTPPIPPPGIDAELLTRLDKASAEIADASTVPVDVALFVKQFDDIFHASEPEKAFAAVDPYLAEGLLGGAVICLKSLSSNDPRSARRALRLGLEQVRQAVRDILDQAPASEDEPIKPMLRWLARTMAISQGELAEFLGVPPRTLQRWLSEQESAEPSGYEAGKVQVVARIVAHLRHSFTGPGTLRWFERPHPGLKGESPASLLDEPERYPQLINMASQARAMVAT